MNIKLGGEGGGKDLGGAGKVEKKTKLIYFMKSLKKRKMVIKMLFSG